MALTQLSISNNTKYNLTINGTGPGNTTIGPSSSIQINTGLGDNTKSLTFYITEGNTYMTGTLIYGSSVGLYADRGNLPAEDQSIVMIVDALGQQWTQSVNGGSTLLTPAQFADGGSISVVFSGTIPAGSGTSGTSGTNGSSGTSSAVGGQPTEIQYNDNRNLGASPNFTFDPATNTFTVAGSSNQLGGVNINNQWRFITTNTDLPEPVDGVINLEDFTTYVFTTTVDLLGSRLVCGRDTTLLGGSSENCRIKSTGLVGVALITSVYSIPIRSLTIEADVALNLSGDTTTTAIDWFGVNFTNCSTIGTIKNYSNVIMQDCAFLESGRLTFDGTIGTVGLSQSLFNGNAGNSIFILPATLTISRRFRIIYSSFIVLAGERGIDVHTNAIIPNDGYILTYCNFAGGGTYLFGVDSTSNEALFINNVGITNSSNVGHYYMQNNATATTGIVQNTYSKAAGTTIVGTGNSPKWTTATTNRLTYAGTITTEFIITVVGSAQSAANNTTFGVGIAENGTVIAESRVSVRAAVAATPMAFATQDVIQVSTGDFFEIFVTNETGTQNITVTDLNVIIQKVTG